MRLSDDKSHASIDKTFFDPNVLHWEKTPEHGSVLRLDEDRYGEQRAGQPVPPQAVAQDCGERGQRQERVDLPPYRGIEKHRRVE